MVTALACTALAASIACWPGTAAVRLAALHRRLPRSRRRWPRRAAPAVLGGLGGLLLLGPGGAIAGAAVVVGLLRRRVRGRTAAAAAATSEQLAGALRRMTDELRSGSHPAAVLGGVGADGPLAREVLSGGAAAARLGDRVSSALRRATAGRTEVSADVERIAVAWSLAEQHGIPLADLLARAHDDIRWRLRFGATVRAQLAGPRATAWVLTALPALGLGLGQLIGADPIGVLRGGALGQGLLVLGIGLAMAGMAWSEHILRAAAPR
jgi:tight adherence protein B